MKTSTLPRFKVTMILITAIVISSASYGQRAPVVDTFTSASFPSVIDAVLRDFPNNLQHITGELVLAQGEFENYASALALPQSEHCIITRYHSTRDTTVSWQAAMLTTDDFSKADRAYRDLYHQLQQCYMQLVDGTIVYLKGVWEPAKEGAAFTTSTLTISVDDARYEEVKVEVELVYKLAEWGVNINIFSKKPDDEAGSGTAGLQ
jgi:hypothetical protein